MPDDATLAFGLGFTYELVYVLPFQALCELFQKTRRYPPLSANRP